MNAELSRAYISRIAMVGLGAGVLSYTLVQPRSVAAIQARENTEAQLRYIEQGEQEMADNAEHVDRLVENMRIARDTMIDDLSYSTTTQTHQHLQRYALDRGLTVTRIEPTRSSIEQSKIGEKEQVIKIETKEYRIECQGAYSGVVAYIDDLQRFTGQPRVNNFRMVPTDENRVRAIISFTLVELVEYPEQFRKALEPSSEHAEADAGRDGTDEGEDA